jgi:hypothetical protein
MKMAKFISLSIAAGVLVSACSGAVADEGVLVPPPYDTFIAASAEAASSKAVLDGTSFRWNDGADKEHIDVWTSKGFRTFDKTENTSGSSKAAFAGSLAGAVPSTVAVYPSGAYTLAGTKLTLSLPASFTHDASSCQPPMAAVISDPSQVTGEDANLDFRHIAAMFKVEYSNVPVTAAKFVLTADKRICGDFEIADCSVPETVIETDGSGEGKSVTVNFGTPVLPGESMTFYVPIPSGTYGYFQIRLKDRAGKTLAGHQYTGPFTVGRADLASGNAVISVTPKAVSKTRVDAAFSDENILDLGHRLTQDCGIQQFGIDKDGNIYYASVYGYNTRIDKVSPSTSKSGSMSVTSKMDLSYSGHLTGMAVEDAPDGTYLWIPEYSDKDGSYYGMKTIGRVKYTSNASYAPDAPEIEHYYLPTHTKSTMNVAIDQEHDRLAVCFWESGHNGSKTDLFGRRVRIYSLSEAKALEPTSCTLTANIADGLSTTITARNLEKLTPLAEIGTPWSITKIWPDQINYYGWQGFDYYDGKVYFLEGARDAGNGRSLAALTTYNCEDGFSPADSALPETGAWPDAGGVLAEPRCFIRVISEPETLDAFGITSTGIAEVEGVKVWKGNLCFGVLSVGFNGENKPKANVFKYRLGTAGENMSSVDLEDAGIIEL